MFIAKRVIEDTVGWEPKCASRHIGDWLIEPYWMQEAVANLRAGRLLRVDQGDIDAQRDPVLFVVDEGKIAHIMIQGPMMKGDSKFGGTNTVRTRRALRAAVADAAVRGIMIHADSPGGTVAGTNDLADVCTVRSLRRCRRFLDPPPRTFALCVSRWAGITGGRVGS